MQIIIINGPNLHNIGIREPQIYGKIDFNDYLNNLKNEFKQVQLSYFQSHCEGDIVKKIYSVKDNVCGIILNAGAYSHTSVAIRDAVSAIGKPVILVHISNIYTREPFRHEDVIAPVCAGIITGLGLDSYKLGIQALLNNL